MSIDGSKKPPYAESDVRNPSPYAGIVPSFHTRNPSTPAYGESASPITYGLPPSNPQCKTSLPPNRVSPSRAYSGTMASKPRADPYSPAKAAIAEPGTSVPSGIVAVYATFPEPSISIVRNPFPRGSPGSAPLSRERTTVYRPLKSDATVLAASYSRLSRYISPSNSSVLAPVPPASGTLSTSDAHPGSPQLTPLRANDAILLANTMTSRLFSYSSPAISTVSVQDCSQSN